jgi:hypothetical protein
MPPLNSVDPIIDRIRKMGCSTARLAAADQPVIDHDQINTFSREEICRGQTGDPAADYANIRIDRFVNRSLVQ